MQTNEPFRLTSPATTKLDPAWPSAVLFETPEQIYRRVYRQLKPRSAAPAVRVQFEPFANANSFIRYQDEVLDVRITDVLHDAPAPVVEALAYILLCKLLGKAIPGKQAHRYKLFLQRRDIRQRIESTRKQRGRKLLLPPRGKAYDLEAIFEQLNVDYFHGLMVRPEIGWSLKRSRTRLGHFDADHNAIVISRFFDDRSVPRLALEYVMFHEMLHLRFPVEHSGGRRSVHTKQFQAAERAFLRLAEAKNLLKAL